MPDILTKQDGPILRVTLNQPERGNAVSDEMVAELTRIIEAAETTSSVVVLRGAGGGLLRRSRRNGTTSADGA